MINSLNCDCIKILLIHNFYLGNYYSYITNFTMNMIGSKKILYIYIYIYIYIFEKKVSSYKLRKISLEYTFQIKG